MRALVRERGLVGTKSALEANDSQEEVSRSKLGEVFCALRVHVTPPYSRVSITSAFSIRTFRLGGAVALSHKLRADSFEAYPQ